MEVKKINHSFYNNKSNNGLMFNGGVSHKLFNEVINGQQCIGDYFKKTHEIDTINNPYFVLDHAVYNAKEKAAEFFLTASDRVRSIAGLENVQPQKITSHGNNLADAFVNINADDLKTANSTLEKEYINRFNETKPLREKLKAKRQMAENRMREKFEQCNSFWAQYYKSLEARKAVK